jgi:hypothetical protein
MDRRRFLLTSVAGVLAGPLTAEAQSAGKSYRIAFLGSTSPSGYASQMEAFRGGLRDFGYVEGQNFVIEFRWAEGSYERLPELAAELVRSKPDVLVTHGSAGALAAKRATDTIPIVMGVVDEAVEIGAVKGVARPGRNVTGSSFFVPELNAKRLEILKEALPRLSRVGVLLKRGNAVNAAVPQDRQGPRPRDPAVAAGAGGPGHRVVDRRRFVLTLLAAALPAPVDAGAQPGKMSRIGYLGYGVPGSDPSESRDCVTGCASSATSRTKTSWSNTAMRRTSLTGCPASSAS